VRCAFPLPGHSWELTVVTAEKTREEPLFVQIQKMSAPEKIHLATYGDKEARGLLIKDPLKQIQLAVVSNPRIKDSEIVTICKSRHVYEDVLRRISLNRDWLKLYPVRLALVQNPKTPLTLSMKLIPMLLRQDLKALSKSKAVPQAIANAARRRLLKENV
jgi:hypothetical protein